MTTINGAVINSGTIIDAISNLESIHFTGKITSGVLQCTTHSQISGQSTISITSEKNTITNVILDNGFISNGSITNGVYNGDVVYNPGSLNGTTYTGGTITMSSLTSAVLNLCNLNNVVTNNIPYTGTITNCTITGNLGAISNGINIQKVSSSITSSITNLTGSLTNNENILFSTITCNSISSAISDAHLVGTMSSGILTGIGTGTITHGTYSYGTLNNIIPTASITSASHSNANINAVAYAAATNYITSKKTIDAINNITTSAIITDPTIIAGINGKNGTVSFSESNVTNNNSMYVEISGNNLIKTTLFGVDVVTTNFSNAIMTTSNNTFSNVSGTTPTVTSFSNNANSLGNTFEVVSSFGGTLLAPQTLALSDYTLHLSQLGQSGEQGVWDINYFLQSLKYDGEDGSITSTISDSTITETITGGTISDATLVMHCFLKGTKILTINGYVAIENLKKNDILELANHMYSPIVDIAYAKVSNKNQYTPAIIKANTFGNNMPFEDLYLSSHHLVFDYKTNRFVYAHNIGEPAFLPYDYLEYYHVLLHDYETNIPIANGIMVESMSQDKTTLLNSKMINAHDGACLILQSNL